jgi:hypothetical protein
MMTKLYVNDEITLFDGIELTKHFFQLFVILGLNLDLYLSGRIKPDPQKFLYNYVYFFSDHILVPRLYDTDLPVLESRSAILPKPQNSRETLPSLQQVGT